VWLTVMAVFPIALLLLRFNRGRLPRNTKTPLSVIILSLLVTAVVFAGNVAINPATAGSVLLLPSHPTYLPNYLPSRYFAAYLIGVMTVFLVTQKQVQILRIVYWTYDQYPALHRWSVSKTWGKSLIRLMARLKRQPICVLVKTDEVSPRSFVSCLSHQTTAEINGA
jgi:hypothetical protein